MSRYNYYGGWSWKPDQKTLMRKGLATARYYNILNSTNSALSSESLSNAFMSNKPDFEVGSDGQYSHNEDGELIPFKGVTIIKKEDDPTYHHINVSPEYKDEIGEQGYAMIFEQLLGRSKHKLGDTFITIAPFSDYMNRKVPVQVRAFVEEDSSSAESCSSKPSGLGSEQYFDLSKAKEFESSEHDSSVAAKIDTDDDLKSMTSGVPSSFKDSFVSRTASVDENVVKVGVAKMEKALELAGPIKISSPTSQKRLRAKNLARMELGANIFEKRINGSTDKKINFTLILDRSGSMCGRPIDDSVTMMVILNRIAYKHRGVIDIKLMFTHDGRRDMLKLPLTEEFVKTCTATGGDEQMHQLMDKYRDTLLEQDLIFIYTDGSLGGASINPEWWRRKGKHLTALYTAKDISYDKVRSMVSQCSRYFNESIIRETPEELIDKVAVHIKSKKSTILEHRR